MLGGREWIWGALEWGEDWRDGKVGFSSCWQDHRGYPPSPEERILKERFQGSLCRFFVDSAGGGTAWGQGQNLDFPYRSQSCEKDQNRKMSLIHVPG